MTNVYSELFKEPTTLEVDLRRINSVKKQLALFTHMAKDRMNIDIPGDGNIVTSYGSKRGSRRNLIIPCHDFVNVTLFAPQSLNIMVCRYPYSKGLGSINHLFTADSLNLGQITKRAEEASDKYTDLGADEIPARQKEFKTYDKDGNEKENIMILCALKDEKAMRFAYTDTPERYKDGLSNVLKVINSIRFRR